MESLSFLPVINYLYFVAAVEVIPKIWLAGEMERHLCAMPWVHVGGEWKGRALHLG